MFYHFIFIFVIIVTYILGFFVLFKNRKKLVNFLFFLFDFFGATWLLTLYLLYIIKNQYLVLFIGRSNFTAVILYTFFLFLFVCFFPVILFKIKRIYFVILSVETILLSIVTLFTDLVDKNEIIKGDNIVTVFGQLYALFVMHYVFYLLLIIIILGYKFKKLFGLERLQIKYLIWGFGASAVIGLVTNIVLPIIWSNYSFQKIGIVCIVISVFMIAYAILRYRLMDIRVIIHRSLVFTVLVLFITALYAVLAYSLSFIFTDLFGIRSVIFNGVIMAILVALGFEPLKKALSEVTDSFLFKAEYKPQEVLAEFSDFLSSTLDLENLTNFLVKKITEVMKCHFTSLFLYDEAKKSYIKTAEGGQPKQQLAVIEQQLFSKVSDYMLAMGKEREVIVREEIKKMNEQLDNPVLRLLIEQLDKYEVNLIVPLYLRDKLVGILFLGDKKSGDVYSLEDLRVLEIVASQSAVAMQNAQLFEEQKKFTIYLKREVDKATKDLQLANIQLKKLDKAKSEFISIASHQLRTPLTVIKGYVSMINEGDFGQVPQPILNPLDRIFKSTLRIIGLVEDLLNISRIESGRMKYDFAKVDLAELVAEVFDELSQTAKNKGLRFELIKPKEKLPPIILDRGKIREVIMNLMDNAIKYTESGSIIVKIEKMDHTVNFSVTDTGRGLEPDEIPLLFQKFSRAKGVQLVHTEGTGLGLYIAKQIVAKHGGEIGVTSPGKDKGSTFYIRFKIENKKLEKLLQKPK
jgi:signal transduction histidine kinase